MSGAIGLGDSGTVPHYAHLIIGCGGRIRTYDLWVMSPTSYHCSTPRYVVPQGFEPQFSGPKPDVLPLHHRTITISNMSKNSKFKSLDYYTIFFKLCFSIKKLFGTSGEIRTPINGFGDRYATIAPHTCLVGIIGLEPITSCVSGKRSNQLSYIPVFCGEGRDRTADTRIFSPVLYLLSYLTLLKQKTSKLLGSRFCVFLVMSLLNSV